MLACQAGTRLSVPPKIKKNLALANQLSLKFWQTHYRLVTCLPCRHYLVCRAQCARSTLLQSDNITNFALHITTRQYCIEESFSPNTRPNLFLPCKNAFTHQKAIKETNQRGRAQGPIFMFEQKNKRILIQIQIPMLCV